MKVIQFSNQKGGAGKTTLSVNAAAALAALGHRVLLIDADPQGHAGALLGIQPFGGVYRLLVQEEDWNNCLRVVDAPKWAATSTPSGLLHLLPGNVETRNISDNTEELNILADRLQEVAHFYDTVIIDTPPTPSLFAAILHSATNALIHPTQPQGLSIDGIAKTVQVVKRFNAKTTGNPIVTLGIQPTMCVRNGAGYISAHEYGMSLLHEHFSDHTILPPIHMSTIWRDAEFANLPVYLFDPKHPASAELWQLVEHIAAFVGDPS